MKERSILRMAGVKARTGLSRTAIYDGMKAGTFPQSFKRGASTCWDSQKIDEWVDREIAEANANAEVA